MVRERVGVCDVSTLGKIDIQGPDAAAFLDLVYTNMFSTLPVGRVRYGLMLRDRAETRGELAEAAQWLQSAAEGGHVQAMSAYGEMLGWELGAAEGLLLGATLGVAEGLEL